MVGKPRITTLYLLSDDNGAGPLSIHPTMTEARRELRSHAADGEGAPRIDALEIEMNRAGVCAFISRYFGVAIFEN